MRKLRRVVASWLRALASALVPQKAGVFTGPFDEATSVELTYGHRLPVYVTAETVADLVAGALAMTGAYAAVGGYDDVGRVRLLHATYRVRVEVTIYSTPVPGVPDGEPHGKGAALAGVLRRVADVPPGLELVAGGER